VTDDVDLKTDWLNPREELTSDVTVPGVDHLLTSEEFRMIESLSSQSDGNASSAAFRNWIWNHQADSAPTLPVLRAVLAFKERNLGDMIQHLSHAAELAPDDMRLRLTLIELCDVDGDLTQAREFLNQLPESSPLLFRFRELKLLQIAIREQDRDRAKAAAERLAGLQLDPETLQFLLTKCRALQFTELTAQLSPQTATPDASPRTGASLEKMNNYVTQGDLSAAAQVARQLIRRSGNTGTPWRRTSRLSPEEIRIRAYDVLKQSGELERMIERQQSQLEKSPHSKVLAQTLLEYLQAADRKKDVEKLRQSMIEQISGDSAESRWQRVQQQIAAGRRTDACSTLLQIFETHPEFILSHFDASVELLRSEQRLPQLIAMITQSPKTRAPSSPLSADQRTALMRVLTNDERLYESAAAWLTSLCEHSPVDALDAIRLIENRESWKHEKMFAILTRVYVPSPRGSVLKDGRESPQTLTFGPDLCWADDYERHVSATTSPERIGLDRLRLALSVSDRRRDFLQSVQQAETQYPNWNRNLALRLMIVLQEPDSQEPDSQEPDSADSVLTLLDQMLASDRQPLPEFIAFELANSLIVTHPEMKPDAMRLLNASLSNVATSRFHLASPALQKFVELGRETNSQASARQDILSCHSNLTKSTVTDNGDRIRIVGTHLAAARALVILDDPEQALRVLEGVTEDESLFRDFLRSPGYAFQDSRHLSSLDADEISKAARSKIATRKATLQ
jgi:tetratricopeptide (TPR) repeat protein